MTIDCTGCAHHGPSIFTIIFKSAYSAWPVHKIIQWTECLIHNTSVCQVVTVVAAAGQE